MNIGNRLKMSREFATLKQVDVTRKTNINNKTLSNWEKDVSKPSVDDLILLSKIYNVSIDFLLGNVLYKDKPQLYPNNGISECPKNVFIPKEKEITLIKKYRSLDDRGKKSVEDTLNREYEFVKPKIEDEVI